MGQLIVPPQYLEFRKRELLDELNEQALRIAGALEQRLGAGYGGEFSITLQECGEGRRWWCVWHQPAGRSAQLAARVEYVKGRGLDLDGLAEQLRRGDKSRHGAAGASANMRAWASEPRESADRALAAEAGAEMGERLGRELGEWLSENGTGRLTDGLRRKVAGVPRRKVLR